MNDIEELQSRISAAMARVADGLDSLSAGSGDETQALRQELEDEKLANAQLSERLRVIGDRQARELAEAQEGAAKLADRLTQMDTDVQQVRKANAGLRTSNQALREANEAGVAEPHLINKAMLAELEALRADRAAHVAQSNVIIDALTPLMQGDDAADNTQQEDA